MANDHEPLNAGRRGLASARYRSPRPSILVHLGVDTGTMMLPGRRRTRKTLCMEEEIRIRAADVDEAPALADVWLRSRTASIPSIPAPTHPEEAVRDWFSGVVFPTLDVWVAISGDGPVVGLLVLDGHWVDQLYVDPDWFGRGPGSGLLALAKRLRPTGLDLWTYASNRGARRFYERHGFSVIDSTDHDNEEAAPALHYRWVP